MLNKKSLSALIIEIIGGVIVVALLLMLFAGSASPFLEFLSDSKNMDAFTKFTSAMTRSCREGSETVPYFSLGRQAPDKIYAISLIRTNTAKTIKNMPECTGSEDLTSTTSATCTTSDSKDRVGRCIGNVCWCLLKVYYTQGLAGNNRCANWNFNGIAVNSSNINNTNTLWDDKLKDNIKNGANIKVVKVLMCSSVQDDIGCNMSTPATGGGVVVSPVFATESTTGGYLVWIQSKVEKKGCSILQQGTVGDCTFSSDLNLDSISFDRPVSGKAFENYTVFSSNPTLTISLRDDAKIWEEECHKPYG